MNKVKAKRIIEGINNAIKVYSFLKSHTNMSSGLVDINKSTINKEIQELIDDIGIKKYNQYVEELEEVYLKRGNTFFLGKRDEEVNNG